MACPLALPTRTCGPNRSWRSRRCAARRGVCESRLVGRVHLVAGLHAPRVGEPRSADEHAMRIGMIEGRMDEGHVAPRRSVKQRLPVQNRCRQAGKQFVHIFRQRFVRFGGRLKQIVDVSETGRGGRQIVNGVPLDNADAPTFARNLKLDKLHGPSPRIEIVLDLRPGISNVRWPRPRHRQTIRCRPLP